MEIGYRLFRLPPPEINNGGCQQAVVPVYLQAKLCHPYVVKTKNYSSHMIVDSHLFYVYSKIFYIKRKQHLIISILA